MSSVRIKKKTQKIAEIKYCTEKTMKYFTERSFYKIPI